MKLQKHFIRRISLLVLSIFLCSLTPIAQSAPILSTLEISLSAETAFDIAVKNKKYQKIIAFDFTNHGDQPTSIQSITLTGYIDENNDGWIYQAKDLDTGVHIQQIIDSLELWDLNNKPLHRDLGIFNNEGKATFTELDIRIPASQTRTIWVVGNISADAYYNDDPDVIAIDIDDADQDVITKPTYQKASSGIKPSIARPTLPTLRVQRIIGNHPNIVNNRMQRLVTIYEKGAIHANSVDTPADQLVLVGAKDLLISRFILPIYLEDFMIHGLTLKTNPLYSQCDSILEEVELRFLPNHSLMDYSSVKLTDFTAGPENTFFHFPDLDFLVLFEGGEGSAALEVYVDTKNINHGGIPGCKLEIDFDAEDTSIFSATGQSSQEHFNQEDIYTVLTYRQAIFYQAIPHFATNDSIGNSLIEDEQVAIYAFDVSAEGENPLGLHQFTFVITGIGIDPEYLASPDGIQLYEVNEYGELSDSLGSGTWDPEKYQVTIELNSEKTINPGKTAQFVVQAPIVFENGAVNIALASKLHADTYKTSALGLATIDELRTEIEEIYNIWSDYSAGVNHSLESADWTTSFHVPGTPVQTHAMFALP